MDVRVGGLGTSASCARVAAASDTPAAFACASLSCHSFDVMAVRSRATAYPRVENAEQARRSCASRATARSDARIAVSDRLSSLVWDRVGCPLKKPPAGILPSGRVSSSPRGRRIRRPRADLPPRPRDSGGLYVGAGYDSVPMTSLAEPSPPTHITVVVKNPTNYGSVDYTTSVPASFTLGDLKLRIASEMEGNPPPSTQRIIYSGALLRDDAKPLLETLGSADVSAPAVFHLVTSHSDASTPSTSEAKRRDPATKRPGPSRADASPNPPLPNPVDSPPPSASSSRSAPRFVRDGTPGTMPGARGGGTPNTPGFFSATPDARDPLARAAYSAAYAARTRSSR